MNDIIFYVIIALAVGIVAGYFVFRFVTMPTEAKLIVVKNWLLYATALAEQEMGAGTGRLKLAKVYNMFIEKFPTLAFFLKYEKFCSLVDEALITLRNLIENNININNLINSGGTNNGY